MKNTLLFLLATTFLFLIGCQEDARKTDENVVVEEPSLKTSYQDDFLIGAALGAEHINGENPKATTLIAREFNSISPENIMKWMHIHPTPDSFDFSMPDKFVALGEKHDMNMIAHTLVWHSQLAPWVEKINGDAEMEAVLEKHISTIVGQYKGRIDGWDVVNEALNEDGTLRETVFLKTMGEDYLTTSFKLAEAADPDAELYYNDYNIEQEAKRNGCIEVIKKIRANGGRVDGVGIQGHWSLKGASIEEIEASILAYSKLGLKVMFTELDITVLPNPWDLEGAAVEQNYEGGPYMNPFPESLPDSVQVKLAERYQDIFELFVKHRDKITRVTFWGLNDSHSWLNGWPIKDRTNYPLLFDRNFEPKKAYHSVMELKKK